MPPKVRSTVQPKAPIRRRTFQTDQDYSEGYMWSTYKFEGGSPIAPNPYRFFNTQMGKAGQGMTAEENTAAMTSITTDNALEDGDLFWVRSIGAQLIYNVVQKDAVLDPAEINDLMTLYSQSVLFHKKFQREVFDGSLDMLPPGFGIKPITLWTKIDVDKNFIHAQSGMGSAIDRVRRKFTLEWEGGKAFSWHIQTPPTAITLPEDLYIKISLYGYSRTAVAQRQVAE